MSTACARKAHNAIGPSVPVSVPERGPIPIIRQQTPAKFVRRNRPKTFRFPACFCVFGSVSKRRLQPLGHLTAARKAKYTTGFDLRRAHCPHFLSLKCPCAGAGIAAWYASKSGCMQMAVTSRAASASAMA
jgi:hypothetical protein